MKRKSPNMMSTTGRMPVMAAPSPMPVKPASEIGVSITRSDPNSSTSPLSTLNGVPASATSSPMRKTRWSRLISSASASRIASAMVIWRSAGEGLGKDMHRHLVGLGVGRVERELDAVRDLRAHLFLDALERDRVGLAFAGQGLGEDLQRVALLAPYPLLFLRAVVGPVDIADVVAVLPVRSKQQERRSVARSGTLDRLARGFVHRSDVLPVGLARRDAESPGPLRQVPGGGLEVMRVLVVKIVLADIDHRELPERGHVHHLVDEALAKCALTEKADRDLVGAALLRRERRAGGDAGAAADDRVGAEVALLLVGDVHRTAFAAAVARLLAEQLREHPIDAGAFGQAVTVSPVRARDVVVVA